MDGGDDPLDLGDRPRTDRRVRAVEIELDEVGPIVELALGGRDERVTVRDLHPELAQPARSADPRPGGADVGPARPSTRAIADTQRERPLAPVDGIPRHGRPDVPCPAHAGQRHQRGVVRCGCDRDLRRVAAPIDPVRAARHREVAVTVDHARDDRRAAGVDDLEPGPAPAGPAPARRGSISGRDAELRIFLGVGRADPDDQVVHDEHAHPDLEAVAPAIGNCRVAVEDSAGPTGIVHVLASLAPATIARWSSRPASQHSPASG